MTDVAWEADPTQVWIIEPNWLDDGPVVTADAEYPTVADYIAAGATT